MTPHNLNLSALNSATKYPSIATYHALGDRGRLIDDNPPGLADLPPEAPLFITEKVDGTNARILVFPDGSHLIGSREEMLAYSGDLLYNPAMGIVAGLRAMGPSFPATPGLLVAYYGEFYGHKVGAAAKQYATDGEIGFRLFDVAFYNLADLPRLLALPAEQIASWRESGGQTWCATEDLAGFGLDVVPYRSAYTAKDMPRTVPEASAWLGQWAVSWAALCPQAGCSSEGVVVRTADRRYIRKARFEDYARTLRGSR